MNKISDLNSELTKLNTRLSEIEKHFSIFDLSKVKQLEAHVIHRLTYRSVSDRTGRQKERKAAEKFFQNITTKDLMRLKSKTFGARLIFLGKFVQARHMRQRFDYDQNIEPFFINRESARAAQYQHEVQKVKLEEQLVELDRIGYGGFFSSKPNKQQYEKKRQDLVKSIATMSTRENVYTEQFLRDEEYLYQICRLVHQYSKEISEIDYRVKVIKNEISEIQKQEKHDLKMAKAAAFDNETRKHAKTVKSKITKLEICPYCNTNIVGSSHLDHIHPVSKGGLNIQENLVDCCSSCNLKKADKGIFQFCKEQGFDDHMVCERLLNLGKHV